MRRLLVTLTRAILWSAMPLTRIPLLVLLLLSPLRLFAFEMGVDGFANANHEEVSLYSHSYVFVGGEGFRIGAVYIYEQPHDYMTDKITAYGFRIGEKRFFELAVGKFERQYNDKIGKGTGAVIQTGWLVQDWLTVSIPFVYKKISEGDLTPRTLIDAVPQVGLRWGW